MLDKVRFALRITSNAFDSEIQSLIDDCLSEMTMLGICREENENDAQILTAVIAYCKWKFGYSDDAQKWSAIYNDKLSKLIASTGYGLGPAETEVVQHG